MNTEAELMMLAKKRKSTYFGHVMRNEKYHLLHVQGKIEGWRAPGRRWTSWMKNLRWRCGKSTTTLFRAAVSKVQTAFKKSNYPSKVNLVAEMMMKKITINQI